MLPGSFATPTTASQQRDTGLPGSTAAALPALLPAAAGT